MEKKTDRKMFSTLISNPLQKEFKKLAIDQERPINDLMEEAMKDFLRKYEKKRDRQSTP